MVRTIKVSQCWAILHGHVHEPWPVPSSSRSVSGPLIQTEMAADQIEFNWWRKKELLFESRYRTAFWVMEQVKVHIWVGHVIVPESWIHEWVMCGINALVPDSQFLQIGALLYNLYLWQLSHFGKGDPINNTAPYEVTVLFQVCFCLALPGIHNHV